MTGIFAAESATTDPLSHRLIHSLQIYGRAPFALIAEVVGVSEQTVARRYRQLESAGILRVLGLPRPLAVGGERWLLRVQCRPDAAAALAQALARRSDVNWVSLSAGGSEVVCNTATSGKDGDQDLLLHRLPRTAEVQSLSAYSILHEFGADQEWTGYGDLLDADQLKRLASERDGGTAAIPTPISSSAPLDTSGQDADLLTALRRDGRMSLRHLSDATGWAPNRVARRIGQLRSAGALYFDVDLDLDRLGFTSVTTIWVTVAPSDLETVGEALCRHNEVAFCAAVTGSANLVLSVVCRDSADLYRYITTRIGALAAVREIETSPMLRRVKQAGSMVTPAGLARPHPTGR